MMSDANHDYPVISRNLYINVRLVKDTELDNG